MNGVDPLQRSPVDWHLPRGWIDGLTLANDTTDATNDVVIAEGVCRSTVNIVRGAASTKTKDQRDIEISETLIKQLDVAWAPGNGGGRSGSAISDTTWHAYGIGGPWLKDSVFFHDSATQSSVLAALPSGYTAYRRIGSVIRSGGIILPFLQNGDSFTLVTAVLNIATAADGTASQNTTLSVPLGVRVLARLSVSNGNTNVIYIREMGATDQTPSSTTLAIAGSSVGQAAGYVEVMTDTAGQVRRRSSVNSGVYISTIGWVDFRGRNS